MKKKVGLRTTAVLGIDIAAVNMRSALHFLARSLQTGRRGYVCFVSVHGLMESQGKSELARSYRDALCCLPDGAPVAWVGKSNGEANMDRVGGPDLMLALFADPEFRGATHFFYGGAPGVADLLKARMEERFPEVRIVGTYTPPFHELGDEELEEITGMIRGCKPDILWVGLGCPKQEIFMREIATRWDVGLLMGVGAAFDFHTGRLKDSPAWVKRAGLQWLHRLLQEPTRLWKRYLVSNCTFVWALMTHAKAASDVSSKSKRTHTVRKPQVVSAATAHKKPSLL